MNLFEQATRRKYRYPTTRGNVSTEDLWDMGLTQLDTTAKTINKQLKSDDEESFIVKKRTSNVEANKLEILKRVIEYKQDRAEAIEQREVNKQQKQRILSIIDDKEDESLKGKSLASLKKMVEGL